MVLQIARLVAILALLCVAAAIATPKGRLPLALRGLAKMLQSCTDAKLQGSSTLQPCNSETLKQSAGKRFLAFALVIFAVILALI